MNYDGFYLTADFLYWRAENQGFSYAYEFTDEIFNIGKINRIDPNWEPAFRVGAGWNTMYDFWDIFLNYTWYRNTASTTRTSELGFVPLWPFSSSEVAIFDTAFAKSRFSLNIGDLEIGRMIYLTQSVSIRPHWGARGGTIHQKFNNQFLGPMPEELVEEQIFSGKNNYWGVGPRTGVSGEWHLAHGFSLLGKLAGALLYGKTDVHSKTDQLFLDETEFTPFNEYADDFYQLVPNMQLALGFQWQTCFWCEKMFFKMSAAWEANYWWNQFNLPVAIDTFIAPLPTTGGQPLTMEGLTVNFELDF